MFDSCLSEFDCRRRQGKFQRPAKGLLSQVFVQISPREFERRPVNILRQDAEFAYIAIDGPVKPGDKVVVKGALLLASEMAQGE